MVDDTLHSSECWPLAEGIIPGGVKHDRRRRYERQQKKLFKLINCADNVSKAGHKILEEIEADKKDWDALIAQEWGQVYRFFELTPGTPQHAAANTGYNRQNMAIAVAIRDGISDDYMKEWETMTAAELLDMLDRQAFKTFAQIRN